MSAVSNISAEQRGGLRITCKVTQDMLATEVAKMEGIDVAITSRVIDSMEKIIFAYLSSTTPTNNYDITLFSWLHMNSRYIPKRTLSKGLFKDQACDEKIRVDAKVTRHYENKINNNAFP